MTTRTMVTEPSIFSATVKGHNSLFTKYITELADTGDDGHTLSGETIRSDPEETQVPGIINKVYETETAQTSTSEYINDRSFVSSITPKSDNKSSNVSQSSTDTTYTTTTKSKADKNIKTTQIKEESTSDITMYHTSPTMSATNDMENTTKSKNAVTNNNVTHAVTENTTTSDYAVTHDNITYAVTATTNVRSNSTSTTSLQSSTIVNQTTTELGTPERTVNAYNRATEHTGHTHSKQCWKTIGLTVGVSATVLLLVVMASMFCLWKMRKKWRKKIRDERQKTDIWSMSTFHNTIVNDNFMDYNLAPSRGNQPSQRRKSQTLNYKSNNAAKLSHKTLGRMVSLFDENNSTRNLRRSTFSEPNLLPLTKPRLKTQDSSYSNDTSVDQSSEGRSRTSTFTSGRRMKNDLHVLVNHDELDTDDLITLHVDPSMPRQEFYITEL